MKVMHRQCFARRTTNVCVYPRGSDNSTIEELLRLGVWAFNAELVQKTHSTTSVGSSEWIMSAIDIPQRSLSNRTGTQH